MTILDTNVVSEPLRPRPSLAVAEWLARQDSDELFITTITQAEMLAGVESLPDGARKRNLGHAVRDAILVFGERVLAFDEDAARAFPVIMRERTKIGRPAASFDAMIAAIAKSRHAVVATRDARGFEHCGIRVVDPWDA